MDKKIQYYIDSLAEKTAEIYQLKAPVMDLTKVVKNMGGEIIEINENCCAVEKTGEKSFKIYIHHFDNASLTRYRIAETLGHLFLHMEFLLDSGVWENTESEKAFTFQNSEQVKQAKYFAMCLIIPREEYLRYRKEKKQMDEMASIFNVPLPMIEERVKNTVFVNL